MNYKNKYTGHIISKQCYDKLPYAERSRYDEVSDEPTHEYKSNNDDDSFSLSPLLGLGLGLSGGSVGDSDSNFSGFEGGSGGGAGASGDW